MSIFPKAARITKNAKELSSPSRLILSDPACLREWRHYGAHLSLYLPVGYEAHMAAVAAVVAVIAHYEKAPFRHRDLRHFAVLYIAAPVGALVQLLAVKVDSPIVYAYIMKSLFAARL